MAGQNECGVYIILGKSTLALQTVNRQTLGGVFLQNIRIIVQQTIIRMST